MIDPLYQKYLKLTNCPSAAATLVLAEVVSQKPADGDLLTVKQAAAKLRVTTKKVYQMVNDGEIRHQRIGNRVRIRPEDLDGIKLLSQDEHVKELEKCFL